MIKVHEIDVIAPQLDKIMKSKMFLSNKKDIEISDFVFFKTSEQTFMTKVTGILSDDEGLVEGYKIYTFNDNY